MGSGCSTHEQPWVLPVPSAAVRWILSNAKFTFAPARVPRAPRSSRSSKGRPSPVWPPARGPRVPRTTSPRSRWFREVPSVKRAAPRSRSEGAPAALSKSYAPTARPRRSSCHSERREGRSGPANALRGSTTRARRGADRAESAAHRFGSPRARTGTSSASANRAETGSRCPLATTVAATVRGDGAAPPATVDRTSAPVPAEEHPTAAGETIAAVVRPEDQIVGAAPATPRMTTAVASAAGATSSRRSRRARPQSPSSGSR